MLDVVLREVFFDAVSVVVFKKCLDCVEGDFFVGVLFHFHFLFRLLMVVLLGGFCADVDRCCGQH